MHNHELVVHILSLTLSSCINNDCWHKVYNFYFELNSELSKLRELYNSIMIMIMLSNNNNNNNNNYK